MSPNLPQPHIQACMDFHSSWSWIRWWSFDRWHVTGDRWHFKGDICYMFHDISPDFFVFMLLSAHIEKLSVFQKQDLKKKIVCGYELYILDIFINYQKCFFISIFKQYLLWTKKAPCYHLFFCEILTNLSLELYS